MSFGKLLAALGPIVVIGAGAAFGPIGALVASIAIPTISADLPKKPTVPIATDDRAAIEALR